MLAEERRRKILELTQRDGRVVVKDLARRFSTSLITIRKDLESLHQMGRLQRGMAARCRWMPRRCAIPPCTKKNNCTGAKN